MSCEGNRLCRPAIEVERVSVRRIRLEAPGAEWWERALLEFLQTRELIERNRSTLGDIVPPDHEVSGRCEALVAMCERCLALSPRVQSPAVDPVANDEIEVAGREMIRELLERCDQVLSATKAGHLGIRIEGPEVEMREVAGIVGRIRVDPDEQRRSEPPI